MKYIRISPESWGRRNCNSRPHRRWRNWNWSSHRGTEWRRKYFISNLFRSLSCAAGGDYLYWLDYSNVGRGRGDNGNGVNLELFSRFDTIPRMPATNHLKNTRRSGSDSKVRRWRPGGDQLHVAVPELVHLAQVRSRDCPDVVAGKFYFYSRRWFTSKMLSSKFLLLLRNWQSLWKLLNNNIFKLNSKWSNYIPFQILATFLSEIQWN